MNRDKSHQGVSGGGHRKLAGVGLHSNNLERDVSRSHFFLKGNRKI